METYLFEFKCPPNYNLLATCHTHGWVQLSPFNWNYETNAITFCLSLNKHSIDIEAKQFGNKIIVKIKSHSTLNKIERSKTRSAIIRSLSIDIETDQLRKIAKKVGHEYEALIKKGAGRLLKSPTLWEDAAKTLFTTNCSWALTKKNCEAVCSKEFTSSTPSGRYPFPPPESFRNYSENQIKKVIPIGYRASYFLQLAKTFSENPDLNGLERNGLDFKSAFRMVSQLKGFGPYASTHILIIVGYYGKIPIDSVVTSYLKHNYRVRNPNSFIERHYRNWGPFKWWGLKLEKMLKHQNWLGD